MHYYNIDTVFDSYRLLILHPLHTHTLQAITYICIDGRTPADMRQALCDQFQHSEQCLVAALSITTATIGTNTSQTFVQTLRIATFITKRCVCTQR